MGKIIYKVKEEKPELDDCQIEEIKVDADNIAWGVDTISLIDLKSKIKRIDDEVLKLKNQKAIYQRQIATITKMLEVKQTTTEETVDDIEIPKQPEIKQNEKEKI